MNSTSPPSNVELLLSTFRVSPISLYLLLNQPSLSYCYQGSVLISTTTSSAYAIKSCFSNSILSSIGLVAMQNNNIESGSPCGTPHLTVGIRSACLAFKNRFRYLMNCGFTPCYFSSAIMTSCGTELKAFWISSYSKLCPLALISSTLARHRICAFFLKAN